MVRDVVCDKEMRAANCGHCAHVVDGKCHFHGTGRKACFETTVLLQRLPVYHIKAVNDP